MKLVTAGEMRDLTDLIPTGLGWTLTEARSINELGQIVGYGIHQHDNLYDSHAFLLTPVPTVHIGGPYSVNEASRTQV